MAHVPYDERCQCDTNRYQVGARGSRIYSKCRARAVYSITLPNASLASGPDAVRVLRACGTHAALYRRQRLILAEVRL